MVYDCRKTSVTGRESAPEITGGDVFAAILGSS